MSTVTSTEFTCTYNPVLVGVSNIVVAGLFGTDPVAAINGPQNGTFIVAVAGSNGNRATVSGTAFTFSMTGLQEGQTAIECKARVSKGDKLLSDILYIGDSLIVVGNMSTATDADSCNTYPISTRDPNPIPPPTIAGQVLASKPATVNLYNADNSLAASVAVNPDGTFNLVTSAGTYTVIATADGFLNQVLQH
ncbi:MAG: carboxypeptidase regulatory-like domain-containing protein [Anaerolineales bacterium]|uniref:carboxypeptidase-like regulatory domain-containing protein n=1 Tax=Candidatus Villigracilis proximus TaxID=3140683 RepID=UPI003135D0DB|nr:carboxypeptidase regulatory-like domain-containing protein [Anaerolineales bacterium]